MEKVTIINNLYFQEKKTLTEISRMINTSVSYVSRILRKNEQYRIEKAKRIKENLERRRKVQKDMIYTNRKNKQDENYMSVKNQHEQAVKELSKRTKLGNDALRKWSTTYKYNNDKGCYEFDKEILLKPADFPKYIKA